MSVLLSVGVMNNGGNDSSAKRLLKLPVDVMVHIDSFMTLPDRVRLAATSKPVRKFIYEGCVPLWQTIDFSEVPIKLRLKMNDEMLALLLIQVKARTVTRSLDLNILKIQGTGLLPLSDSETLETCRMPIGYLYENRCLLMVVRILRTMLPFKLSHVCFDLGNSYPSIIIASFLRDLRHAELERARDQQITCTACNEAVWQESRQLVEMNSGVSSPSCITCRRLFCRRGSCTVGLADCVLCDDTSCDNCKHVKRCNRCALSYCHDCNPVHSCSGCSEVACNECFDVFTCSMCEKSVC